MARHLTMLGYFCFYWRKSVANLEDLIDPEYGLQQDEWSLTRPRFGEEGQLEVIGWSGRRQRQRNSQSGDKHYTLKCSKCNQDPELFGGGYFKSTKSNLERGKLPCGCSATCFWTKEQYTTLCSRKAEGLGYKFLGFVGKWGGQVTKIKLLCGEHGEWSSGTIKGLISGGTGCPGCKVEVIVKLRTKPDSVMVESFLASGAFHPDTKFWRSERKDSREKAIYWNVYCPDCRMRGEAIAGNLRNGKRPCKCSPHRQQESYINLLRDLDDQVVAIKFGVANNSEVRVKQQNNKCFYEVSNHSVYYFPDKKSCIKAENECLQKLVCGVISKEFMPDGYTETTWAFNLDKIISIYEKHGGKRIK